MTVTNGRQMRGFTLIEVVIALFIFSLIASGTIYALRLGIDAERQLTSADGKLRNSQVMRTLIKEDLAQLLQRSARDEFGNPVLLGFQGGLSANSDNRDAETEILMRFVRNGWTNPGYREPRASIQYVEYLVRDETLIRRTRPFVDAARDLPTEDRPLQTGITDVEIAFVNGFGNGELLWADRWPVIPAAAIPILQDLGNTGEAPPRALRLTLDSVRTGPVEHLFWIGEFGVQNGEG